MADAPAPPTAQQLLDEALVAYRSTRGKILADTAPYLARVQALAAAAQAEQLTRIADLFERTLTVEPTAGGTFVRTWPGRT